MNSTVDMARSQYSELGFDTLPLISGTKKPCARAWQSRLSFQLWQITPPEVNIGIRGGGPAHVAFIDCDDPRAFENVTDWMAGLGYRGDSYPVVQTASGTGRHIYVTFSGALPGDARNLSSDIGAGEFRYGPGAYVVAPPSSLHDGGSYFLISGDFSFRPALETKDIFSILGNRETVVEHRQAPSRKAVALLNGKNVENYSSRSEAEQSLIASLINSGYTFCEVLNLFNNHPCAGKFAELKTKDAKKAERWLLKSYNEAEQWTKAHESKARQLAKAAIEWAETRAWQGKTGPVDQLIYLAHANFAYRAGRLDYAAACRDLAECAGVGFKTAIRATRRLCNSGFINLDKEAVANCANIYQLGNLEIVTHSLNTSNVRKCVTMASHDAFRWSGLGKSAAQIWQVLQQYPASIAELVQATGRQVRTVQRALDRMVNLADPLTGEYLPMVASDDGETYHALSVDLDRIAQAVGTAGAGERQRKEHARDRWLRASSLKKGRDATIQALEISKSRSTSGADKKV